MEDYLIATYVFGGLFAVLTLIGCAIDYSVERDFHPSPYREEKFRKSAFRLKWAIIGVVLLYPFAPITFPLVLIGLALVMFVWLLKFLGRLNKEGKK